MSTTDMKLLAEMSGWTMLDEFYPDPLKCDYTDNACLMQIFVPLNGAAVRMQVATSDNHSTVTLYAGAKQYIIHWIQQYIITRVDDDIVSQRRNAHDATLANIRIILGWVIGRNVIIVRQPYQSYYGMILDLIAKHSKILSDVAIHVYEAEGEGLIIDFVSFDGEHHGYVVGFIGTTMKIAVTDEAATPHHMRQLWSLCKSFQYCVELGEPDVDLDCVISAAITAIGKSFGCLGIVNNNSYERGISAL